MSHDPYDEPVGVFEGTRWHMHSEPICADPDCVTYLTREEMAALECTRCGHVHTEDQNCPYRWEDGTPCIWCQPDKGSESDE